MFVPVLTAFALTAILLLLLAPLARVWGLVDRPSSRKQHHGDIPLIGGLAMFLTLVVLVPWFSELNPAMLWYLTACGMLVVTGVVDDRLNINVAVRTLIEIIAALMMIYGGDLWVGSLGNLLGFGEIYLPRWFSTPFTIIAVFGITNAWNMIDGMDGLVGVITLVALAAFYMLTHMAAASNIVPVLLIGATAAYLLFNLGSNRLIPKVFMGDAGSKLIGFSLVWLLIDSTQRGSFTRMGLPAVLTLFIVGLPLIDMVVTTMRRIRKGKPPFEPDRTHIHHVLQQAGFSHQEVLLLIAVLSIQIAFIGAVMYLLGWQPWVQFCIFWFITLVYFYSIEHAWKVARWLDDMREGR
ncbi:MAG: undecaprenyl-phosphate alpha-N-acetylglucosaminyl 1-phosphate transferase [Pseudomonadota bacterium]